MLCIWFIYFLCLCLLTFSVVVCLRLDFRLWRPLFIVICNIHMYTPIENSLPHFSFFHFFFLSSLFLFSFSFSLFVTISFNRKLQAKKKCNKTSNTESQCGWNLKPKQVKIYEYMSLSSNIKWCEIKRS